MDVVTVPGSSFRWILIAAKLLQLDIGKLLFSANLDPALAYSQDEPLPFDKVARIRDIVRSHFPHNAFALEVGQKIPVGELGVLDYVCLQSSTLAEAMDNLSRYFKLVAHPRLGLTFQNREDGGYIETTTNYPVDNEVGWFEQQSVEFTFSVILNRIRFASQLNYFPQRTYLRYPKPNNIEAYECIFGQSIVFGYKKNMMVLPKNTLEQTPSSTDFQLYRLLRGYADKAIEKIPDSSGIEARVLQVLKNKLPGGNTTLNNVAPLLNMSSRTLHRKLKDSGTSYNELRETLRHELAKTYLTNATMTISDISYLLGFSQVSAFHRAFKRWTGITPQDYRKSSVDEKFITRRDSR